MFRPSASGILGSMVEQMTVAKELVDDLAAGDFDGLGAHLAQDVVFRFMTPGTVGELVGDGEVAEKYRAWFGDADRIEVVDVRPETLSDRTSLRYRLRVHEPSGWSVVEQQVYLDVDDEGRISSMNLLCSGFRPTQEQEQPEPSAGGHAFDAGDLGCADGLAREFRRRILAIPPGDVLVVETRDPAAKEDLPPLARMMGHTVRSVESRGDGRLLITVERGR